MHRAPNTPSASRVLSKRLALIAGLAAVVAGCTTVTSSLTGVRLDRVAPTTCVGFCKDFYASLVSQELKLREENLASCRILPQPQRGACLEEEGARHAAEMLRIDLLKEECLTHCVKGGLVPG